MSITEYKLCWHNNVVYKLKFVWLTEPSNVQRHEMQQLKGAVVEMARRGPTFTQISTDLCYIVIDSSPWKLSGRTGFRRGTENYTPHRSMITLQVFKKRVNYPRVSYHAENSSSEDSVASAPRRRKRPAVKHRNVPSQSLSLVPKRQRVEPEIKLPLEVQEFLRGMPGQTGPEEWFTVTNHTVTRTIRRKVKERGAYGREETRVVVTSTLEAAPTEPPAGEVDDATNLGLLGTLGRMLLAPFSYIAKRIF